MSIQLKKLTGKSPFRKQAKNLYNSAFPREERAPFRIMISKADKGKADFLGVFDGDTFVGLAYMICNDKLAYLFYLAVNENLRGKGYGSQILSSLKERYKGRKLFLALEEADEKAPNFLERQNRRKFYKKNGFSGIPCKLKEATVIYDVMSIGGYVTAAEYDVLITQWSGRLMKRIIDMRIIEN